MEEWDELSEGEALMRQLEMEHALEQDVEGCSEAGDDELLSEGMQSRGAEPDGDGVPAPTRHPAHNGTRSGARGSLVGPDYRQAYGV